MPQNRAKSRAVGRSLTGGARTDFKPTVPADLQRRPKATEGPHETAHLVSSSFTSRPGRLVNALAKATMSEDVRRELLRARQAQAAAQQGQREAAAAQAVARIQAAQAASRGFHPLPVGQRDQYEAYPSDADLAAEQQQLEFQRKQAAYDAADQVDRAQRVGLDAAKSAAAAVKHDTDTARREFDRDVAADRASGTKYNDGKPKRRR